MTWTILDGDVRDRLRDIPDRSIQCVVTSPPYYGLRNYNVAGQIGLEPSLAEFVATLVDVFRNVRRVLRDDGTVWLNLGDTYHTDSPVRASSAEAFSADWDPEQTASRGGLRKSAAKEGTLKNKDLMMVPARVAIALQDDGWWLRSDIIWHKPSPMPESVRDRPTNAHEHIFLLTKSARYYYDRDAIREPMKASSLNRLAQDVEGQAGSERANGGARSERPMKAVVPSGWDTAPGPRGSIHRQGRTLKPDPVGRKETAPGMEHKPQTNGRVNADRRDDGAPDLAVLRAREKNNGESAVDTKTRGHDTHCGTYTQGANARNVWTIASAGFPGAHFATFTPEIPKRCILAGSREGDTVLDPFAGAGTTLLVADRLGRHSIGIELNPEYARMARERIRSDAPLFAAEGEQR